MAKSKSKFVIQPQLATWDARAVVEFINEVFPDIHQSRMNDAEGDADLKREHRTAARRIDRCVSQLTRYLKDAGVVIE